jgi:epoxide hydrolase-like predicted phosphatase
MSDAWAEYLETLNSELAGFVRDLRPRYKTGIISNSFVGARKREQDAYGFEDLCDVVVYSHEVGYLKPDPRIYRVACERVGVLPEEAVLVDDVDANVQGARSIGMTAIKFIDNHQALTELNALLS